MYWYFKGISIVGMFCVADRVRPEARIAVVTTLISDDEFNVMILSDRTKHMRIISMTTPTLPHPRQTHFNHIPVFSRFDKNTY